MHDRDQIVVSRLELLSCVGVPDEERAEAQRLTVDLRLFPLRDFTALGDEIANTVDYFALTRRVRRIAADRPRKLIETLANDIAECVLREFALARVEVELRKYILADTDYVAVRVSRGA